MHPSLPRLLVYATTFATLTLSMIEDAPAPPANANYDESKIPAYTLPDPLVLSDGTPVTDADTWRTRRRPEILQLFVDHVYGPAPGAPPAFNITEPTAPDPEALNGKATRRELRIALSDDKAGPAIDILLFTPNKATEPVPAFLGLNFSGNHSIHPDPAITLSTAWMRQTRKSKGIVDHRATEEARGTSSSRWPVETIIDRGYALATVYCGDIDPDFDDGFKNGIHALFTEEILKPAERSTIAAWAWGLSRALDALESIDEIDATRVAVLGHSRLGKTALWAGAQDERFAMVISNNSGCGGAALSRRRIGETVGRINTNFPHWFCDKFNDYSDNEDALPVDQHLLLALVAPRPLCVASATEDQWADPKGEFLSAKNAEPVYKLLGAPSTLPDKQPAPDTPAGDTVRYHLRTGKHDVTPYDWSQYLNAADRFLK